MIDPTMLAARLRFVIDVTEYFNYFEEHVS